jgi:hypothetical protein
MSEHTFKVFPDERLMIVRWFGSVRVEEVIAWLEEMISAPQFSPDFDGIVDLRKADLTKMRPEEVRAVARVMVERKLTRGRWVHLADGPTETAFSMMYSRAVSEQYQMHVFSTVEAAADFLGRDAATLRLVTDFE